VGYLYLDTARLGQTSPGALRTQLDFARLTAEQPSSLYFDRFLANGIETAPQDWFQRFPGLQCWGGISKLKAAIKQVALAPSSHEVVLASRSALLMRAAARLMFRVCKNVLVTDCSWPAYQAELHDAAARANRRVTCVNVRDSILDSQLGSTDVVRLLARRYEQDGCDGLFLPAVDNLGVRLPIREIVSAVEAIRKPRFVLVDGAQALGHLPNVDCHDVCDLFLAGCHKWLRAYLPLGIAIFGKAGSREWIHHYLVSSDCVDGVDDPLLRFTHELEADVAGRYSETVNIAPLFACRAAITDTFSAGHGQWKDQLRNADEVRAITESTTWRVRSLESSMRTGILLLVRKNQRDGKTDAEAMRQAFADHQIAASTYENGIIRLSMPQRALRSVELEQLATTLTRVTQGDCRPDKRKMNFGPVHPGVPALPIVTG
jgi:hypothetical protein